jgi:hypothetical protein
LVSSIHLEPPHSISGASYVDIPLSACCYYAKVLRRLTKVTPFWNAFPLQNSGEPFSRHAPKDPGIGGSPLDFLWNLVASVSSMRLSEKKQVMYSLAGEALATREIQQQVPPLRATRSGRDDKLS